MSKPTIYWAQNKEVVYMRVALMGAENVTVGLEEDKVKFQGEAQKTKYEFEITLHKPINKEESKYRVMGQGIEIILKKKEEEKEFWPQINLGGKLPYVRIDWDRWVDEDDDEKPKSSIPDFNGMDFGGMGDNMPDMSQFKLPEGDDKCDCHDEGCHCHDHECKCEHKCECEKDGCKCCEKDGECKCGDCKCCQEKHDDAAEQKGPEKDDA